MGKEFYRESEVGEYSFDGTITGYEEIIKIKVTAEEVETVDFQDKNSEILRYGKLELPRTTVATTTSGRKITSPIVWKYTGNITGVNMVESNNYNRVNTDFIGNHNIQGTVLSRLNLSYPYRIEIKDDFIYYSGTLGFSDVTMRAKKDGSNPTVFFSGKLVHIVGDYIYYYQGGNLQRMKLDGSSKLVYSDITSYNNIIIKDDYIYYATYDGIYKKNTNGTGNTLLVIKTDGYKFTHFSLFEGFIYYDAYYPYEWIWRVKTDGTINEIVGKYY